MNKKVVPFKKGNKYREGKVLIKGGSVLIGTPMDMETISPRQAKVNGLLSKLVNKKTESAIQCHNDCTAQELEDLEYLFVWGDEVGRELGLEPVHYKD